MDFFKTIIGFLTGIAIFIAIINLYFKANKIWKRRRDKEVAESQSIVALTSEALLYILWSVSFIINSDWNAFADNAVGLVEATFFIIIGSGIFVIEKKRSKKSFWIMIKDSLKAERKEATYLLKSLTGKNTAEHILKILIELAWVDGNFHQKEKNLVREFAKAWGLKVDENLLENNPHKNNKSENDKYDEIINNLASFIDKNEIHPQQGIELKEIFLRLINADGEISKDEDRVIGELNALIDDKILKVEVPHYLVISVPQEEIQRVTIENVIKGIEPDVDIAKLERQVDGGYGFILHECRSIQYADLKAEEVRNKYKLMTIIKKEIRNKFTEDYL
jgi:tellurite resistance protein